MLRSYPRKVDWDTNILVIYSVLAGLSFAQCFDTLTASGFSSTKAALLIVVFYIVLENWYYLHVYLRLYDIDKPTEVVFYLFSILLYSCLPFLYVTKNIGTVCSIGPPEFLMLNLSLICLVDGISKHITLMKFRTIPLEKLSQEQIDLVGSFMFYAMTGYFYFILLALGAWIISGSTIPDLLKAATVFSIWFGIRVIDRVIIPRISGYLSRFILLKNT